MKNGFENGYSHVYLDYNATTPLAPSVADKISETLISAWGNPSSSYPAGKHAKQIIEEARNHICSMVNGNHSEEVIFMSGGTEANNNIIHIGLEYFREHQEKGIYDVDEKPHFISSTIEHDSILKVLEYYEHKELIDVTYLNISPQLGCIDVKDVIKAIRKTTIMITIMLANNETGALQPISEMGENLIELNRSHRKKHGLPQILLHTDAAQALGKINVDVRKLGVDYLTVVGHKFYAPRIGALWVKEHAPFYPMMHGGGQEKNRRSGTENTCMIAGLGEAARLVVQNLNEYNTHFIEIKRYLKEKLASTFGGSKIVFNEPSEDILPNTVNVSVIGENLASSKVLGLCKILQASKGAACHTHKGDSASPILLAQGVPLVHAKNAIRLSIGRETSKEDVDRAVEDLFKACSTLDSTLG